jgi:hypothetical protein
MSKINFDRFAWNKETDASVFLSLPQSFLICLMAIAFVSALPAVDETVFGDVYETESLNPSDPQSFLKLKKIKKILFG